MRPNLSLNFGLRYAMQLPFYAKFDTLLDGHAQ